MVWYSRVQKLAFYDVYSLWFSHRLLANQSRYIHINSVRKFSALFNNSVGKCLHSFYYIFRFTFTAASLTAVRKRTDYTRNERSREHSLPGTKVPGTFVPGSESSRELSFLRAKVPTGDFRSEEQKYRGAKSHDTVEFNVLLDTV